MHSRAIAPWDSLTTVYVYVRTQHFPSTENFEFNFKFTKKIQRLERMLYRNQECIKNKSMQHHTLGSGTAEFQVTWPPKLREGTYLVKNVRPRFEYRKTIAAHEKQVIMQEKAQPCVSLWRKTLRPKRVRFLAIDAPIVDYVCLQLYHLTFLGSYQPLCEFSWRKKKEKAR